MKNIHVLPTHHGTRLHDTFGKLRLEKGIDFSPNNKNIYITSNEEPKLDQWGIRLKNSVIFKCKGFASTEETRKYDKKIILTTDQDLIKDGVQAIEDDFLEWFINNPTWDKIGVEEEVLKLVYNPNYLEHTPEGDGIYFTSKHEKLQREETLIKDDIAYYTIIIPEKPQTTQGRFTQKFIKPTKKLN